MELPARGGRRDPSGRRRLQRQRQLPLELLVDARGARLERTVLLDAVPVRAIRHRPHAAHSHRAERVRGRDGGRRPAAARRHERDHPAVAVPQWLVCLPAGVADHA